MISDRIGSDRRRCWMASSILKQSPAGIRHPHCTGMRTILAFTLAATLLAQTPSQTKPDQATQDRDQPATIKVDVDIVNVLASVRDKRGGLVANLEKNDFTILEDGKPQGIKYFTKESDLPLTIGLLIDVSGSQRNLIDI